MILISPLLPALSQSSERPVVSDISAVSTLSNKIEISWKLPENLKNSHISSLLLYKDSKPITDTDILQKITPVILPKNAITYVDKVQDFKEYYYAVIVNTEKGKETEELYYDEEKDEKLSISQGKAYKVLLPGVNSTVVGAKISYIKTESSSSNKSNPVDTNNVPDNDMRYQPLPYMNILEDNDRDSTISAKTKEKALSLLENTPAKVTKLDPYIFEEDILSPQGGDDYLLFVILSRYFIQRDYETSIKQLNSFLGQNRNKNVTLRATFYLGECYYYYNNYPRAISLFLSLEEFYPNLVKKWSESALDLYTLPDNQ